MSLKIPIIALILVISLVGVSAQEPPFYSENAGNIYVRGENNISDLRILNQKYFSIEDNVCQVKVPIIVQGTLIIDDKSCDVVKLYPKSYITITGSIYFENVRVSSHDPITGKPMETSPGDGVVARPYINIKAPAKYFYASNSEFSHLGYYDPAEEGSKWGIAFYNVQNGKITNSNIHHNYFGVYTFNTENLIITDSEIHDNIEYGLDFHDYSSNFYISDNEIYQNGNHALIFSKFCRENVIKNNIIRDNDKVVFAKGEYRDYGTHGIMLHHYSENNLIENNTLINNRVGIYLMDSENNRIINNKVVNDNEDGIYLERSNSNEFVNNNVTNTQGYSLYLYYSYDNSFSGDYFGNGLYFKGEVQNKKIAVASTSTYYDLDSKIEEKLSEPAPIEKEKSNDEFSLFGINDKVVLSRVLFIGGVILVIFVIIILDLLFGRHKR